MEHALVILCGGKSTRMGTDKALLPFGDSCLIEYLVSEFSPYFSKIYLSVKIKGDYAHLNLDVTEIPDLYANAGPLSGVFSALSMIDEENAFFMSVDTPFLEPATGLHLLDALGDADICTIAGSISQYETPTGVFSKNCITTIGKCLLLHQLTFKNLHEKCKTTFLPESDFDDIIHTPLAIQYFSMDTRAEYYHALRILSGLEQSSESDSLIEYFHDKRDLFEHSAPVISVCSKPGTIVLPFLKQITDLLEKSGYHVCVISREQPDFVLHNMTDSCSVSQVAAFLTSCDLILLDEPKSSSKYTIEVLRKGWNEELLLPEKELLAVVADFSYKNEIAVPVFDSNRPRNLVQFLRDFMEQHR